MLQVELFYGILVDNVMVGENIISLLSKDPDGFNTLF